MFELMRYVSKQVVKRQGRMGWSGATCVHIILEIRVVSLVTVLLFTTMYKSLSLWLCVHATIVKNLASPCCCCH